MTAREHELTDPADLTPIVGHNLRRLRTRRGLSLERLAAASRVSRAMLSQLELGQSTPSINILWKVARALDLPFSALLQDGKQAAVRVLREKDAKLLSNRAGSFTSRALFPFDGQRRVEFYELLTSPRIPDGFKPQEAHRSRVRRGASR